MLARTKLAFLVAALGASTAFAQTNPGDAPGAGAAVAPPAMDPKKAAEMQKMMAAWQKFATPGAEHAKLKAMAGSYDVAVKMWMDPKAPAQESAGKAELTSVLGDRYLRQEFTGTFMGQPFNGMGLIGYDNAKKKYISSWVDSGGTGFYGGEGVADNNGVITFATASSDPITGKIKKGKDVWIPAADGSFTMEMWGSPSKGGPFKMMEIKYSKKK